MVEGLRGAYREPLEPDGRDVLDRFCHSLPLRFSAQPGFGFDHLMAPQRALQRSCLTEGKRGLVGTTALQLVNDARRSQILHQHYEPQPIFGGGGVVTAGRAQSGVLVHPLVVVNFPLVGAVAAASWRLASSALGILAITDAGPTSPPRR
ncbi:MAG: hypothetical protein QOG79_862 [Mycobacterium sp.]|jgi:hypothetical protein|nr:hypothetical protein [Mycobacterium sp.]MDT5128822.1 hypothetical protein [Mycobacterium sp.]MDT5167665.1 hypothetical protein [Mycobacterium sp.]MDT5239944.1 hypothetical protein [Mycobacterium sp.]MDT5289133.1 hypothetical protein [Mycobacterium sp.]